MERSSKRRDWIRIDNKQTDRRRQTDAERYRKESKAKERKNKEMTEKAN